MTTLSRRIWNTSRDKVDIWKIRIRGQFLLSKLINVESKISSETDAVKNQKQNPRAMTNRIVETILMKRWIVAKWKKNPPFEQLGLVSLACKQQMRGNASNRVTADHSVARMPFVTSRRRIGFIAMSYVMRISPSFVSPLRLVFFLPETVTRRVAHREQYHSFPSEIFHSTECSTSCGIFFFRLFRYWQISFRNTS